jgi:hypothetical protein
MNYQRLILVGNATNDAEHMTSKQADVAYASFGVEVSDGKDRTTFFSIIVFGEQGEAVAKHVTKGRQILVDGWVQMSDKGRFRLVQLMGSLLVDCLNSPMRRSQGDWSIARTDGVVHTAGEVLSTGHSV